jgi:hypothetical protein
MESPEVRLLDHIARNAIRDIRVKFLWIIPSKIYKSYQVSPSYLSTGLSTY